jgi:DNA-binding transcriptional LysR family regulator
MMSRRELPTLDRLRALSEVVRLGSFSRAATSLGLTQPAISNQIRHLERQFGARLLERMGKRARPTPEGEILVAASSRAFGELEKAMDDLARRRAEITGTLVLATGPTATKHLLPPIMAALRARHPGIELRILTGNTADLVPGLLEGTIDLGLLTAPVRHSALQTSRFFRDRLVCIAPPAEASATRIARPTELEGRQLILYESGGSIRRAIDAWLEAADPRRLRITDIGSAEAQVAFVRAGFGWSILSEIVARDEAAAGRVDMLSLDPPLFRDLELVWRADRATRPMIAAALDIFSAHAAPGGAA